MRHWQVEQLPGFLTYLGLSPGRLWPSHLTALSSYVPVMALSTLLYRPLASGKGRAHPGPPMAPGPAPGSP